MDARMQDLLAAVMEHGSLSRDDVRQAGEHGADTGWGGFTYTSDAADFTRENRDLVWTLLAEEAESMGAENVAAYVASFNRSDMADDAAGFDCLLAWWALETCGRWVEDNSRELREADEDALRTSGEAAGRAAGSWASDGNSTDADRREIIRAADECELEIPSPLSGEWADGWTPERVFEDADVSMPEDDCERDELLTVWEDAYREGFESQAVEDARGSLSDDEPRDARTTAADYHSGQASALYAFASSGTITLGLASELRAQLREGCDDCDRETLADLLTAAEAFEDEHDAEEDAQAERHERNERALTRAFGSPGTVTRVELPADRFEPPIPGVDDC